jgi:hypothetical protein
VQREVEKKDDDEEKGRMKEEVTNTGRKTGKDEGEKKRKWN